MMTGRQIGSAVVNGIGPCTVYATEHKDFFDLLPERADRVLFRHRSHFTFTKPLTGGNK